MKFEEISSIKIGKALIWSLGSTLLLIETFERLNKIISLDAYTFILINLCILLILAIYELIIRNKRIFKYK